MNLRYLFDTHLAQTSTSPLAIEIERAEKIYLYSKNKKYIDLIGGISVANIGHSHPKVIEAIKSQADKYMHIMVYGELVQSPQVLYAQKLSEVLGKPYDNVYFTNSGAEAIEAAMKISKRLTQRPNIFSFKKAYHGSTQGALSLMGGEYWKQAYRPLLPGTFQFDFNDDDIFEKIDSHTAAVFVEPIQGEAGVVSAHKKWLEKLKSKCNENGTLLIFDEIQSGFGRCGSLFAFQKYDVKPDFICLGKALGGGMPLGALVSSKENMDAFSNNPVLGHLTTFGGHPVSCATGLAATEVLISENLILTIELKNKILRDTLVHKKITALNTDGLWAAVFLQDEKMVLDVVKFCLDDGLFIDWFLFAPEALRISPPLSISPEELEMACKKIVSILDKV